MTSASHFLLSKIKTTVLVASLVACTGAHAALIDRAGGLIYDSELNVTWLQDSNYAKTTNYQVPGRATVNGLMDWDEAMAWVENLSYYDPVRNVTWTDWRLPAIRPLNLSGTTPPQWFIGNSTDGSSDAGYNIAAPGSASENSTAAELAYMYHVTLGNTSACPVGIDTWSECVTAPSRFRPFNAGLFSNLGGVYFYNSREGLPFAPPDAWAFEYTGPIHGYQTGYNGDGPDGRYYAWAVRNGDVGAVVGPPVGVPEPGTAAMLFLALGLCASLQRRRAAR